MLALRKTLAASALGLGLLISASPALAGTGRDQLKSLPKDSAGVVVINVEKLVKSALFLEMYKMVTSNPQAQAGLAEFGKTLGTDPLNAVRTVVVGLPKGLTGQGLVVITAAADPSKIELAATQAGMSGKESFEGATLMKAPDGNAMALLGSQVFLGTADLVKTGVSATKGKAKGGSVEKNAALMKLVGSVPHTRDFWFAAQLSGKGAPDELKHAQSVRGGIDVQKGLDLQVVIAMDSAAEATKFATETKAKLDQAKGEAQAKMLGLDSIANKLSVVAKAKEVEVKLPLDEADVARLKTTIGMFMMMANGAAGGAGMGGPGGAPTNPPMQFPPPTQH